MQALVTGGSGFIGSAVISRLIRQGIRVRALLRHSSSRKYLEGLEYETALGDLSDLSSLKKAVEGVDYVFHLAGAVSARNKEEFFRHNAGGTENLARAAADKGVSLKRFIYVSSLSAAGPATGLTPRQEHQGEDRPVSHYGMSKLEGEKGLARWSDHYATTVVRPPAVYGPRDQGVFEFVKMVNRGVLPVFPSRTETREKYISVIHVEDLVEGIVQAGLGENQGKKEVFFMSGDGVFAWSEIFRTLAAILNKRPVEVPLPMPVLAGGAFLYSVAGRLLNKSFPLNQDKLNELKQDYWICSNERAKRALGFAPRWGLQEGLSQTVGWYKQNGWIN